MFSRAEIIENHDTRMNHRQYREGWNDELRGSTDPFGHDFPTSLGTYLYLVREANQRLAERKDKEAFRIAGQSAFYLSILLRYKDANNIIDQRETLPNA